MMFTRLNAYGFAHKTKFYHKEFEELLSKIVECYKCMISNNVCLINDENSIRDYMLSNYLKKQWFKEKYSIKDYLFDSELPERTGRVDIRIMPINPFINDEAYFIIECKRLNSKNQTGKTGLNAEYISEGICRFVSKKYSTYHKTNGMIGFIIDPIDIHNNVAAINYLLKNTFTTAQTAQELRRRNIANDFAFSYCSIHKIDNDFIMLYHLMFALYNNIS